VADLAAVHPEIEGLLHEVAADPHSCLLRLPTDGLRRSVRRAALPDTAATTGLRPAERELLRTWRHETAYLLLLACYRQQITAPENKHIVYAVSGAGEVVDSLDTHWTRLAREYVGLPNDAALFRALTLLGRCTSHDGRSWPSVYQLAAASARLAPGPQARNYAALDLILNGNEGSGVRMLHGVENPNSKLQVMAASNLVYGHERLGHLEQAYTSLLEIKWSDLGLGLRCFFGLCLAAQLGRKRDALMWSEVMEEMSFEGSSFGTLLEGLHKRRTMKRWAPTPGSFEILCQLARTRGERIGAIKNAFA
jgi:hypothetical protein